MKREIDALKRKLKKAYLAVENFKGYDCGHSMMCQISTDYLAKCIKFNTIADELYKLDDKCPDFRYKVN